MFGERHSRLRPCYSDPYSHRRRRRRRRCFSSCSLPGSPPPKLPLHPLLPLPPPAPPRCSSRRLQQRIAHPRPTAPRATRLGAPFRSARRRHPLPGAQRKEPGRGAVAVLGGGGLAARGSLRSPSSPKIVAALTPTPDHLVQWPLAPTSARNSVLRVPFTDPCTPTRLFPPPLSLLYPPHHPPPRIQPNFNLSKLPPPPGSA
uniref:Protein enabled homolog n=1 Tax=Phascolarctos cinereus TaxID=38626 RepID=A0A6P5KAM3_PHACI|nr:protein enabled homolog [Phascolarctos cinereus]